MNIYLDEHFPPLLARALDLLERGGREPIYPVASVKDAFPGADDEEWFSKIPIKSVVITQDKDFRHVPILKEIYAMGRHMLVIVRPPKKGLSYWDMVWMFVRNWSDIRRAARGRRPATYILRGHSRRLGKA